MTYQEKRTYTTKRNVMAGGLHSAARLLAVLLMLLAGTAASWAQSEGLYYIDNAAGHSNETSGRYYLIPADDPQQENKNDAFYSSDYSVQNGDPEKPFLTTYKTNKDAATVPAGVVNNLPNNSVWILKAISGESGYFQIIHPSSGKYVVYEPPHSSKYNRKSMHLLATDSPGENAKFEITEDGTGYKIRPKSITSGNMFFNPSGNNHDYYHGNGGQDSPAFNYLGTIGLWKDAGGNSTWYIESTLLAAPTISDVDENTNTFTITDANSLPEGYTIRYTTDGSTTPTATTGTEYSGQVSVTDNWTVKAVVVRYGVVLTEVATKAVSPLVAKPVISFDNTNNEVSMNTCVVGGATIYYNTGDGSQADPTSSSSTYSAPFVVTTPTTVKAIAIKDGIESDVATLAITQVATPTIQNNGSNAISITSATEGVTIYYTTDGSTPTTSSTQYTEPLTENVSNVTIKAIAVKENMITSEVGSGTVKLQCATPVISRVGMTFTLSCSKPTDANLYYTLGGGSEEAYTGTPISFSPSQLPMTVTAVARHSDYTQSQTASMELKTGTGTLSDPYLIYGSSDFANFVTNVNNGTTASACYKLGSDVSASGMDAITTAFTGTFDGGMFTISGLTHPLFNSVDGGKVKNVMLSDVSISSDTDVGAIANSVTGTSEKMGAVYNCGVLSGSVSGSGNVGSLVGTLGSTKVGTKVGDYSYARVINCFSYANVSGGSEAGGIVGYNMYASTAANLRTMVMNCMFYGDITGGDKVSPIYGGEIIDNLHGGLNTYNYYSYEEATTFKDRTEDASKKYNCALAVEKKYLNRFEFYRLLLNSNKKLAAWYATGYVDNADQEMAKWVLETADRSITGRDPYPYPILKAQDYYPSIINYDAENAPDSSFVGRNHGGKLGKTLSVSIGLGTGYPSDARITESSLTLTRTDKDFDRFNYNYDKVQLPYYNDVGEGNYTDGKVVTGWKITSMTGGTEGSFSAADDFGGYNFADRKCTGKDLYGTSERVFSQGAYFDVPYGVTDIYIEPYWGNAAFVADEYYDVVYNADYGAQKVTQFGEQVSSTTTFNGNKVYNNIDDALGTLSGSTVYDNAIVLVGNLHQANVPSGGDKAFTVMSVDEDNDHEPDYSMIYHHTGRTVISPIRFDFINIPGTAQAQKPKDNSNVRNFTIFKTKGWFETTNTCLVYSNQVEYENQKDVSKAENSPLILLGGDFEQFVSTQSNAVDGKTNYIHIGSNVHIQSFGLGTHGDGSQSTPHIPVSVTGGAFDKFYLSGTYNQDAVVRKNDNAECYISGGYFKEAAGACQEQIDGDVHWQIYNADIDEFFGGGINAAKPVTGHVTTDIYNSHVTTFCGGPKFGDMQSGKKVTTNAEGCVFGKYFGGGYGGTSYSRKKYYDEQKMNWSGWSTQFTTDRGKYFDGKTTDAVKAQYGKKGIGVATDFDYEFFVWSTGGTGGRFFVKFASFSLAQCNDVESNLKSCTINNAFYGGGCLGNVSGTAKSVLDDCTVNGNVFGGGYSATKEPIQVRNEGFVKTPNFNKSSGMFEPAELSGTTEFTWKNADEDGVTLTDNKSGSDLTNNYVYTDVNLNDLGKVGYTDLTIKGDTYVSGNVFGGGDMSSVNENTLVKIQTDNEGRTINYVYGGGNTADVDGDTKVEMTSGTVSHDVFGGGKGQTTVVGGDVTVNIGTKTTEDTYTGTGTVTGSVYGGSALGAVNAKKEGSSTIYSGTDDAPKNTKVNIYSGTVNGSVYGGGLGEKTESSDIAAKNFGPTTVTVENSTNANALVKTAVYGGANVNGVLKGDATVTITGGTIGPVPEEGAAPVAPNDVVFGGGKGEPTLVEGNVEVNIGTMTPGTGTPPSAPTYTGNALIYGHVYGGSALGNVNTSKPESSLVFDATKKVDVNLYSGTIKGDVYGGGLGQKNGVHGATSDVLSYVGGNVNVTLDGAKLVNIFADVEGTTHETGRIFGCNNLNGTPKGHVKVHVKRTKNFSDAADADDYKNISTTPLAERTTYDVEAVYGGGNQADYVPTNATLDPSVEANKTLIDNAFAEVLIEGCALTSIADVYGGGNAAAVPATQITINEAYIIDRVFGGGNGAGEGNPGADVGVNNRTDYEADKTTGIYGTGIAKTKLVGGEVHYVYGGSNTKGNVRGGTSLERKGSNTCELKIGEIYGAGQVAPMDGDVNIVLECMPESFVEAVYGGAKNAVVNGNVSLTVTSGKYGRVFGGNNEGGSINGSITVNAYEDGCKPLIIGELYGGGFKAPYSIYGCTQAGETWTANESGTTYYKADRDDRVNVEVNVYSCTSIGKVFGGGYKAPVIGNTHVWINMMKGLVDDPEHPGYKKENPIGKIGQVFGGGNEAVVKGNTTIDIGTAPSYNKYDSEVVVEDMGVNIISGDDYLAAESDTPISLTAGIYGGGNAADVEGNTTLNIGTANQTVGGKSSINIQADIFGGGYGETTTVTGDVTVNIGGTDKKSGVPVGYANITGDVYGGSAKGKVNATKGDTPAFSATAEKTTSVNFYGGTITGSMYGGGLGEATHAADVYGPVTVNVYGGKVDKVFGCNNVLGSPQRTATVNINGTSELAEGETYAISNVYGGGNQAAYNGTGGVSVTMAGGYVNDVFGGGLGASATVNGATSVTLTGGNVTNDIYGGGSQGNVTGAVTVALNGGTVARDVYGGGLGDLASLGKGHADVAADVSGPVTVSIVSGTAANVFGCNNVNGAPLSTVDVEIGTKTGESAPFTYGGTATISGSVYGGGNMAAYGGTPAVKVYGGTVSTNIYGGGLGATAVTGGTSVAIEGGAVGNDVYGGGSKADVTGNVTVTVSGGTVQNDVYGGGALANTNTANWDATNDTWSDSEKRTYYEEVKHVKAGETVVTGFYTRSGSEGAYSYTEVTEADTKAAADTRYYKKLDNFFVVAAEGTEKKTTVNLTGGVIGNAYGGGLGRLDAEAVGTEGEEGYTPAVTAVAANVYGDVTVTVNGTVFTNDVEYFNGGRENAPKHGRVFGCNNINGTPKGAVTVEVYQTRRIDGGSHVKGDFEIVAVYGGGNLANYVPVSYDADTEFGQRTHVIIDGCSATSISKVYGGGNAADVPITDVDIEGAFEIGYVFGGGNGGDKIYKNGSWQDNPGANVTGYANVMLRGGTIGQAFGGSDTKGTVGNTDVRQETNPDCPLHIVNLYGAGNGEEATSEGDINVTVSACGEGSEIQNVFGGSYKANIKGSVTLTITSGIFTSVYGGNDRMGSIGGNITVNIEETGDCNKPIIIQNLYGGCYQTAYPGAAAQYKEGNELKPFTRGKITVNVRSATRIDRIYGGSENAEVNGDTEVNINMIRGSQSGHTGVALPSYYAETGAVLPPNITVTDANGYVEVNGLVKDESSVVGYYTRSGESEPYTYTPAEGTAQDGVTYYKKSVKGDITAGIGTIGDIYGGGNKGNVTGNSTVNIGTATTVTLVSVEGDAKTKNVRGAHITGDVFGGCNEATVKGNSEVNICAVYDGEEEVYVTAGLKAAADDYAVGYYEGVKVEGSVYGGGNMGSVGTYTYTNSAYNGDNPGVHDDSGIPTGITGATGTSKVNIMDYAEIGPDGMTMPTYDGNVFGACKGSNNLNADPGQPYKTYVNMTSVTIGGHAFVKGSVYGGGENGHVLGSTDVKIQDDCQIGNGDGVNRRYTTAEWAYDGSTTEKSLAECAHWSFEAPYAPYDPYSYGGGSSTATDGHTFYGNVYGGGSGYFPYAAGKWLRSAGNVYGNTKVTITGGHVLTNVYGGNELTDVGRDDDATTGKCTITMSGGTIGVPRTLEQIALHPVTCYLFGAGAGDQRTHFNTWTNVNEVEVNVTGGIIYGSVFGGGEDGHVLGDVAVNIGKAATAAEGTEGEEGYKPAVPSSGPTIGTWGTSYVDGNVFGGGRGFSGEALTAGSIGGNVEVEIKGGTMLGSVYGGGRMAAVGVTFVDPFLEDGTTPNPSYGLLLDDKEGKQYGHVTVNISGGTIGKAGASGDGAEHSGNVFGGSMGRNTLLDRITINPLWPKMGVVKLTEVNISGGTIMRDVYGGAELAVVRNGATVKVSGGTIEGSVFGGGYGSDDHTHWTTITAGGYSSIPTNYYTFTPMIWNGCVSGDTNVEISGGWVKKNVYGGGNMASVGLINFNSDDKGNWNTQYLKKHESLTNGFGLSWPYEFQYIAAAPNDLPAVGGGKVGGKATVTITGGRIGSTTSSDVDGHVFGGGKGKAMERYTEAFCANVRETEVNVSYGTTATDRTGNCIVGAVYGGSENGHVYEDAKVKITGGLIGMSVYGAGKGIGTYSGKLRDESTKDWKSAEEELFSWTAGKVYGNTTVTMSGGHVMRNIYGGGYNGSVGKGNYAGGTDDYFPAGYGETLDGNLWTSSTVADGLAVSSRDNAWHFLNSGKATVTVTGGKVGTADGMYDGHPTGQVYGGSRGKASKDVMETPRYEYAPDFYLGYVNETEVTIGDSEHSPTILGSVYGGGRDGHVRRNAKVTIVNGTIGLDYSAGTSAAGSTDITDTRWRDRGNVYGSGSGLGTWDDTHHGMSSGSVTGKTTVIVNGGTIYNNVYGGGAMSSVGPPILPPNTTFAGEDVSATTVAINDGIIGTAANYAAGYGGCVFGASRGGDFATGESPDNYATTIRNTVNIAGGDIAGSVYGGGQASRVKENITVNLTGGSIAHDAFGGGMGTRTSGANMLGIAADVGGNVTVELNNNNSGETAVGTKSGCSVQRIFGCNDLNGTPRGHVKVHVYATQHPNRTAHSTIGNKNSKFHNLTGYSIVDYAGLVTLADTYDKDVTAYTAVLSGSYDEAEKKIALSNMESIVERAELESFATTLGITSEIATYQATLDDDDATASQKKAALENMRSVVSDVKYDVQVVYGGGNLAPYEPYGPVGDGSDADCKATQEYAEVIIDGCELTSIRQVYGGGNAASTPANTVTVNGTHEIDELFGGGNGKDPYQIDGKWYENPGANVGYYNFMEYVTTADPDDSEALATHGNGSKEHPYVAHFKSDATQSELREANYSYGSGVATTNVLGGRIHNVYGGSNEKGNIRSKAQSGYDTSADCSVIIDNTYGSSKTAETDAEAEIVMQCVDYMAQIFGGSTRADLHNDVNLTITNGQYGSVYGGNDESGHIYGSITVNIVERGCKPIVIDNLYGGGYLAPYSVYGYYKDAGDSEAKPLTKAKYEEKKAAVLAGHEDDTEQQKNSLLVTAGLYTAPKADPVINVISATKIGNIYGGGNQALVIGNPHININMQEGTVLSKYVDENPTPFEKGPHTVNEHGTKYTYYVERLEALPGSHGRAILSVGNIGNVYGGGNLAEVDGDTHVEIGTGMHHNANGEEVAIEPARDKAYITNNVFGGGLGLNATVKGNTFVNLGNGARVSNRVYGGGSLGSVGTATATTKHSGKDSHTGCIGKPTAFADGTGTCNVTMSGGRVGPFTVGSDLQITPTPMTMPVDPGYVFGAGRGELADPTVDKDIDFKTYVNNTYVTIKNGYVAGHEGEDEYITRPLVAGGVYGGSEDGRVLKDTHVYIQGGQIGIGAGKTEAYPESAFIDPTTTPVTDKNALAECAHWTYESPWRPYDPNADNGHYDTAKYGPASTTGTDGHTFYGNVFGGGSGYFAYEKGTSGVYEWLPSAGLVEGDTHVEISGGHILTSVYGGNELTDVTGTCHVTMTGGTLGVPRTLSQIAAHPVTCYLFGAGKGDQRVHFNKKTNVGHTDVNVSGGIIYGSVFGGGEDGHVLGNTAVTISDTPAVGTEGEDGYVAAVKPVIGTWGTSYVEGNIFGGGRGFGGDACTAGNVAGSVTLNISGGQMLGSVYGGGRLGSVGYGLYETGNENYGKMLDDNKDDVGNAVANFPRGHVTINITGGTIGNTNEFKYIAPEVTGDALTAAKANMPYTELDENNRLSHTKGGNVFGGGMGRRTKLDGSVIDYVGIDWKKLGNVKSTKLTIDGDAWIMGNVYGGGELGAVTGNHTVSGGTTPAGTEIIIKGGTIGTEITAGAPQKATYPTPEYGDADSPSDVKYTFGSVFGGGYGTEDELKSDAYSGSDPDAAYAAYALWNGDVKDLGAFVADNTYISMTGGLVRGSVFGGGEVAAVGGSTSVNISGGKIGRDEVMGRNTDNPGYVLFGGATMGNVYGGGKGTNLNPLVGVVRTNTNVNISAGTVTGEPFIYHNVYGGGALASVGVFHPNNPTVFPPNAPNLENPYYVPKGVPYGWTDASYHVSETDGYANVTITGGTIGISGRDNGMVNGSSRGDVTVPNTKLGTSKDPYDRFAWVNKSYVTIGTSGSTTGPLIKGSVYGGGENGHNNNNATVTLHSGTIGIADTEDPWYTFGKDDINEKAVITRGNIYGAGCGTDTYWIDADNDGVRDDGELHNNPWAGCVSGDTYVNIDGGWVTHNVYGGGSLGSVGVLTADPTPQEDVTNGFGLSWPYKFTFKSQDQGSNGNATVNIKGGRIGTTGSDNGDVFGGARGKVGTNSIEVLHPGSVKTATVNIDFKPNESAIKVVEEEDSETQVTEHKLRIDTHKEGALVNAIAGSVYGGGEDGLVYENTQVNLTNGLIGHAIYGGGKGKSKYGGHYSIVAGKVYGNTSVNMTGGHVLRNVYGGGNLGSVGKGNYAGGADDLYPAGYGEKLTGNLWTSSFNPDEAESNTNKKDNAWHFLGSGKATVNIEGGTVGYMLSNESDKAKIDAISKDDLPTGNVFGGCRGQAAAEEMNANTNPDFFLGYVNETEVTIGTASAGPRIYGSVYGGGQDGHVRRSTNVTMKLGEIGIPYNDANKRIFGTDLDNLHWLHRGNIYGGGSGIGMYKDGGMEHNSSSAGSVTCNTTVNILGGIIHRNVYGGGSLASVCPPAVGKGIIPNDNDAAGKGKMSLNLINIGGGSGVVTIGTADGYNPDYGGNVFGASRGETSLDPTQFALSVWTKVNIKNGSTIMGNVFGGGDNGSVLKDSNVEVGAE